MTLLRSRPALTLIELLLFLGLVALSSGAILSFILSTGEGQIRQQSISDVEQNGTQLLQAMAYRIRHAERVIDPPIGSTGSVLALQVGAVESDPTLIGIMSGTLMLVEKMTDYAMNEGSVTISNFLVRNTSAAANRPSVAVSFTVSRMLPVSPPVTYERDFEGSFTLFPDDQVAGNACACGVPTCESGIYVWQYCESDVCATASGSLRCD